MPFWRKTKNFRANRANRAEIRKRLFLRYFIFSFRPEPPGAARIDSCYKLILSPEDSPSPAAGRQIPGGKSLVISPG
jgi:hypothetical protein